MKKSKKYLHENFFCGILNKRQILLLERGVYFEKNRFRKR